MKNFFSTSICKFSTASASLASLLAAACVVLTLVTDRGLASPASQRPRKTKETEAKASGTKAPEKVVKAKVIRGEESPSEPVPQQIRGMIGLASGLQYVGNAVFVLGVDYARMIRPDIWVVGGLTRWSNTYTDPSYSIDFALTAFDAGIEYALPVTDQLILRGQVRGGAGMTSAATQESIIGEVEKKNKSVTAFGLTLGAAAIWKSGPLEFGGELRKPFYFAELAEGGSAVYLLGTLGFNL